MSRSRPRVLLVSGQGPPTIDGVGDYTATLIDGLARARPEWSWVHLYRRPRFWSAPLLARSNFHQLRPNHIWKSGRNWGRTIRAARPDVVHIEDQIHSFWETDGAVQIARGATCPVVTTLHEFHDELASVRHTIDLVGLSDVVIASDARTAQRCEGATGRAPDATFWSPSSVVVPGRRVAPVAGRVVTFGFLSGIKSLGLVFEGLQRLRSRWPELHWKLVGPFEPGSNPAHAALARELDAPWAQFTGALHGEALSAALAEAAVLALPFADGASPRRTTLQAGWSLGVPVVTTPPSVAEPSIRDGVNVRLVHGATGEAWSDALGEVIADGALADRLRAGGLATAEGFGWPRLIARHLAIYEALLSGGPINATTFVRDWDEGR